ncbi:MAG: hypothetical protein HeimC3_39270 [Candidatus Heimdallarchaeota archaeon LC_3]|nr:MAG: hypothetical protein HeimC3_39270 [Candidatus Heimdallarchaeota archaeon LC_3]
MRQKRQKKIFLSYSHSDSEIALKIANDLNSSGINAWYDKWEINPGDSLIDKIFKEGLKDIDYFIILLSNSSVKSKWVNIELNSATISRIEGITKIIPILIEKSEIPLQLRSFLWIDLTENYQEGIKKLINSIHEIYDKPTIKNSRFTLLHDNIGTLSKVGTNIGIALIENQDFTLKYEKSYSGKRLLELTLFNEEEINEGIEELEENGLVKVQKYMGTGPFNFGTIEPTYMLFLYFKEVEQNYNPFEDIKIVAATVEAKKNISGPELMEVTKIPPVRINRASTYLEDFGIVNVKKYLGSAPFLFSYLTAKRKTKYFLQNPNVEI